MVWNDPNGGATGGGISTVFPKPSWQDPVVTGTMRGVPDVAGDASPQSGYVVRVDGQQFVIGGTSAVAPLWAGLTALINQKRGAPVGFISPQLYSLIGTLPCRTSPTATTTALPPGRAGMPVPVSGGRSARSWRPRSRRAGRRARRPPDMPGGRR